MIFHVLCCFKLFVLVSVFSTRGRKTKPMQPLTNPQRQSSVQCIFKITLPLILFLSFELHIQSSLKILLFLVKTAVAKFVFTLKAPLLSQHSLTHHSLKFNAHVCLFFKLALTGYNLMIPNELKDMVRKWANWHFTLSVSKRWLHPHQCLNLYSLCIFKVFLKLCKLKYQATAVTFLSLLRTRGASLTRLLHNHWAACMNQLFISSSQLWESFDYYDRQSDEAVEREKTRTSPLWLCHMSAWI